MKLTEASPGKICPFSKSYSSPSRLLTWLSVGAGTAPAPTAPFDSIRARADGSWLVDTKYTYIYTIEYRVVCMIRDIITNLKNLVIKRYRKVNEFLIFYYTSSSNLIHKNPLLTSNQVASPNYTYDTDCLIGHVGSATSKTIAPF